MLKKMILGTAICFGLLLSTAQVSQAQGKTLDELKAEREVLKSEMKSKEALERTEKMDKLEAPKPCEIQSVDGLAINATTMLLASKENSKLIPEMYKRTIGETTDGVTDVTVKKPTLQELIDLSVNLATQIKAISDASANIAGASDEISKEKNPMKIGKATKVLNYSKEVISLLGPELQLNLKVVNNLIATMKSSNNN
ncbi:MAG TPA: hypothetical protein DCQ31_02540 [Bacteroidales bacterium]|nr:hypothetical protein [Bacteroidales bacterium]